ncbi:MAG: hypothetical protein Q7S33_04150, partial [Nanoarchaeota archaeon]|nr:hypothetical protein [Nanoarchaeota archaeon]
MVYKRYIKRGDKIFGPYFYNSRKENGKVVSDYVGKPQEVAKKSFNISKNFVVGLLVCFAFISLFSFSFFYSSVTGRAIFDFSSSSNLNLETPASYNLGDLVYGNVSLKLKNGELIPADSVVRFSLNKQQKDVLISDLISAQSANG